jgi:predicted permease
MMSQSPLLDLVINLSKFAMLLGWVSALWILFQSQKIKQAILSIVIPFYVFYSVLKMEESFPKKVLAILIHGAFIVFAIASILKLIMTPPQ